MSWNRQKAAVLFLPGFVLALSAGCGGGGNSFPSVSPVSTPTAPDLPVSVPPGSPGSPAAFGPNAWAISSEYIASNGLGLIHAAEGYAARMTGEPGGHGRTVAVLDGGIDADHPDLDSVTEYILEDLPFFFHRDLSHGTSIAGIIAGRRDGKGIHGVAYNARLVSVVVVDFRGSFPLDLLTAGIASAAGLTKTYGFFSSQPAAVSDVISISASYPHLFDDDPSILEAMRDAAKQGKIIAASLGNCGQVPTPAYCLKDGDDGIGPTGQPASRVADSGVAGFAIAVGSLDRTGAARAAFSNTCGPVKRYCLFAPGEFVYTTEVGGGYHNVDGTSFAAPHVSGAAALVWGAFPLKAGDDIVNRLLTTADPIDGQDISDVFGHGKLNLGAALNPVGFLSLSTQDGVSAPVANSLVTLPPGFRAPSGSRDAVVYDEQGFAFRYDLTSAFRRPSAPDGALDGFLELQGRSSSYYSPIGEKAAMEFSHQARDPRPVSRMSGVDEAFGRQWAAAHGVRDFRVHLRPAPELTVSFGQGAAPIGASNGLLLNRIRRAIAQDPLSVAPFAAFAAGRGPGVSLSWQPDELTVVDVIAKDGEDYFGQGRARLASAGFARRIGDRLTIDARLGVLREEAALLGIRGEGAFAGLSRTATDFLDLGVSGRVSNNLTVFGSLSRGITRSGAARQGALVSEWSSIHTGSFAVGGELSGLSDLTGPGLGGSQGSDRITLTVASPFRASRADLWLNTPDEEVADGVVSYRQETVNLAPEGRETRVQLLYEAHGGERRASYAFGGYVRFQPGHDESASPRYGLAAKVKLRF